MIRRRQSPGSCLPILLLAILVCVSPAGADDFLSTGEVAGITAGSAAVWGLGQLYGHVDSGRSSLIGKPMGFELAITRWLGGTPTAGKANFLDDTFGSTITPISALTLMTTANLAWPQAERSQLALQDAFLFTGGIVATKGLTDLTKGLTARQRPLRYLYPEVNARDTVHDYSYDHRSFFSGHASSAFFSMAFLNLRTRSIMRGELTPDKYRDWRWAPPLLFYGWATVVGWSRIEGYRHYITDVAVGALVGALMAELFYSLAPGLNDSSADPNAASAAPLFTITIRF